MKENAKQILGVRMTPELAREVKAEAAQRNMSLRKLFEEVWQIYTEHQANKKSDES